MQTLAKHRLVSALACHALCPRAVTGPAGAHTRVRANAIAALEGVEYGRMWLEGGSKPKVTVSLKPVLERL